MYEGDINDGNRVKSRILHIHIQNISIYFVLELFFLSLSRSFCFRVENCISKISFCACIDYKWFFIVRIKNFNSLIIAFAIVRDIRFLSVNDCRKLQPWLSFISHLIQSVFVIKFRAFPDAFFFTVILHSVRHMVKERESEGIFCWWRNSFISLFLVRVFIISIIKEMMNCKKFFFYPFSFIYIYLLRIKER